MACSAKRPLARVNRLMHQAFDDTGPGSVVWMPAHTSEADVGIKKLSDGSRLTAIDRKLNGKADEQAKIAAESVRAPLTVRQDHDCYMQNIEDASIWLGMVTWMAGNLQGAVKRDTGASAIKAMQQRGRNQAEAGKRRWPPLATRPPSDGGHLLVSSGLKQWCAFCGVTGYLHEIGHQKCKGTKRDQWHAAPSDDPRPEATTHERMLSGSVVWCDRCGAYGTHRGCGLAKPCPGPATMGAGGGKWQRLMILRNGRHPKEGTWLGTPIPEARWSMATVSDVNIALIEIRKRNAILGQKVADQVTVQTTVSRLERVRQRVKAKELVNKGNKAEGTGSEDSSLRVECTGGPSSNVSRFEAMRRRIKCKEMEAVGLVHDHE